ncbi:PolC-type DNA polymerase III [Mycoplasmopsis edwardii]|uniref:PolC-type DNA polymerase III n=1 Tax=Mycoplasmopsis edwardii TaxID=53558 RepID=A0ACD4PJV0_9BACT|nr:PolC-type DNA polymerase III [Mycoplasmopsis edwardii]WBP84049.1 PolC-type DNA polymerase III [Mycoplasmopsis edwardii]
MEYRDNKFKGIANYINLPFFESMDDVSLVNQHFDHGEQKIYGTLLFKRVPKIDEFLKLLHHLKIKKNVPIIFSYEVQNYYQEQEEFRHYIFRFLSAYSSKFGELLKSINPTYDIIYSHPQEKWLIKISDASKLNLLEEAVDFLNKSFYNYGLKRVKVVSSFTSLDTMVENKKENITEIFDHLRKENKKKEQLFEFTPQQNKAYRKSKSNSYTNIEIQELKKNEDIENFPVTFKGLIYKNELIERPNVIIHKYWITNKKDAVPAIQYVFKDNKQELIKVGEWVIIEGLFNPSGQKNYSNEKTVKIDKIIKTNVDTIVREDNAKVKRVELNSKSVMNAMDGLLEASDIVNIAKKFGHSSVAILDSTSAQSFPKFYTSAKDAGIKPIYGVSFDVINRNNMAFLNEFENQKLLESTYVIFDIETTHLSPKLGELIEFGATIIENNEIKDKIQFFVKAKKPLSDFTIELTKITDQILEAEGIELDEALNKIYNILNNKVAVAHNANFDMNFVVQKFLENGLMPPKTVYMDSLVVSKLVSPESKKHKLGDFCKAMNVDYDTNIAHRADYDAEVLARAMLKAFEIFISNNVTDFNELYNYLPNGNEFFKKVNTYNNQISIIALNQAGLKELFKLVSLASVERQFNGPKLFWDDIPKSNNLLMGSGGLKGELIDALLYSSDQKINNLIKKFDYIEIPHPETFMHKTSTGDYTDEDIKKLLKELILKAKEMNKKVVAIGDVRFENEDDKLYYKSLVYAKGIGGTSHFAFDYKKASQLKIPNLSFLTTEEMISKFSFLGNIDLINEIVIENTRYIDSLVSSDIKVFKEGLFTPEFDNSAVKLPELVYKTAREIYGENLPKVIEERIEKELQPILKHGFHVIYWISHILVKKANDNGYHVGSRGSVGSSIVATFSGITEINPLNPHYICPNCKYFELVENPPTSSGFDLDDKSCPSCGTMLKKDGHSIPFETFLGFNADKVPDIDLNFPGEFQANIHAEVRRLFGEKRTFRAGTISAIQEKTAYGYIKASNEDYHWNYSSSFIDYLSTKMTGIKRTTGQHPGGIIVLPEGLDIEDFTPINIPADNEESEWNTTHFDYKVIHDNLLKLDLLGHVDPTAIKMLERLTGLDVKKDVPAKDPDVISLFSSTKALKISPEDIGGETTGAYGLPEFGTDFVRRMLVVGKPQSFADLIAMSGLSHGENVWSNNAELLVVNENKKLSELISCRDDIMNFLIQYKLKNLDAFNIMEKVRKGKGLTEGEEKLLREHKVPEWAINSMKLIKYMFPRAHAAAYVLMAWRIAWFKLYKPLEYYATFFTTRLSEFDIDILITKRDVNSKIHEIKTNEKPKKETEKKLLATLEIARELYARGFAIKTINLEKSLESEWVIDYEQKSLIAPFTAIKGLGESVAKKIVQSRNEAPFKTKEDFKKRSGINNTLYNEVLRLGVLEELDDRDQMTLF